MRLHANSPSRATRTPAFCISVRSASQRDSGHCSGYHDVPSRIAGGAGGAVGVAPWLASSATIESAQIAAIVTSTLGKIFGERIFMNIPLEPVDETPVIRTIA